MQIAWLPQSICHRIDQCSRNFIWKGNSDRGVHGVSWDTITKPRKFGGLGVRRTREANTAMLGKLVADVHFQKDKLWVQLITNKYIKHGNFLFASKTQGSPIWNAISKARLSLQQGYSFRLGDGDTSLWYSPWSHHGKVSSHVLYVDIHDVDHKLKDIIVGNDWNLESLYTIIPEAFKNYLLSIPPITNDSVNDCFIWSHSIDGTYSAKSGYNWLTNRLVANDPSATSQSWSWIWKDYAPEKIRVLIWSACHESLPTASMLHHRNMLASPQCMRCNAPSETILHILRDCPLSRDLWTSLNFNDAGFFAEHSTTTWLYNGVSGSRSPTFVSAIWWNWRARNSIVLANEVFPLYKLRMEVHNLAIIITATKEVKARNSSDNQVRWVSWHPSRDDCVVVNVDGSSFGNPGPSGMGGVIRNNDGSWLVGFAGFLGVRDNLFAELMALYRGLSLAWEEGYRNVTCYSDSQLAIDLVLAPLNNLHGYATIIKNIKDFLRFEWTIHLYHTLREGNSAADFMAKHGANNLETWTVFRHPPPDLKNALAADASRVLVPRI